jgi:hypothetical protein
LQIEASQGKGGKRHTSNHCMEGKPRFLNIPEKELAAQRQLTGILQSL